MKKPQLPEHRPPLDQLTSDDLKSPVLQNRAYRWVFRDLRSLPSQAKMLLGTIVDQSVGMGRKHWSGAIDQFLAGIPDKKNGGWHRMPMTPVWSHRMFQRWLHWLEHEELITVHRHRDGMNISPVLWAQPKCCRRPK
jgi:hypothetical protein